MKKLITVISAALVCCCMLAGCASVKDAVQNISIPTIDSEVIEAQIDKIKDTIKYNDEDTYKSAEGETVIEGDVESIDIKWATGDVEIVYTEVDHITISETGMNEDISSRMHYRLKEGKLTVQYARNGFTVIGDFNKNLTVQLPKNTSFEKVDIELADGDLEAEAIIAEKLDIDVVSGNVIIGEGSQLEKLDVEGVSFDFEFNGSVSEEIDIENVSGNSVLNLVDVNGYTLKKEALASDVILNPEVEEADGKYIYGDGSLKIEFDAVSGSLELNLE